MTARRAGAACVLAATLGVAACAPSGPKPFDAMSGEEHLACAVDISAFTYLMAEGKIPADSAQAGEAALALGWHRNAYAAPLKTDPAAAINAARAAVMTKDRPDAITNRASACIAAAVAKGAAQ